MSCIIIIGLPASGKSYYSNSLTEYVIFDDFIGSFFKNSKEIIDLLRNNKKICLIDPRLTDFTIFEYYINIILNYTIKDNIFLILFENNTEKCLINAKKRTKLVDTFIINYSKIYDITNYTNFNHKFHTIW